MGKKVYIWGIQTSCQKHVANNSKHLRWNPFRQELTVFSRQILSQSFLHFIWAGALNPLVSNRWLFSLLLLFINLSLLLFEKYVNWESYYHKVEQLTFWGNQKTYLGCLFSHYGKSNLTYFQKFKVLTFQLYILKKI